MVGVSINGTNTLTQHGLIMLNDLAISAPSRKENRVDIPGANGTKDFSNALVGYPTYEDRTVSFTLFKMVDDNAIATLRATLETAYGGRSCSLITPDDTGYHWVGVPSFGGASGYNKGRIACTWTVAPYRLKNAVTTVTEAITTNSETITLTNAGMPVVPTLNCTADCTITDADGNTYSISAGTDYQNLALMITGTSLTFDVVGDSAGTLTITYQEGRL